MRPEITYKLEVKILERTWDFIFILKDKLHELGITSYSEGFLDEVNGLDFDACEKRRDELLNEDYVTDTIIIHAYNKETLVSYLIALKETFGHKIEGTLSELTTASWLDQWKDNFEPIETDSYRVCPPWRKTEETTKKQIIIEPAMAFGTGQHETTQICLKLLGSFLEDSNKPHELKLMDLGTGSGILAIAAAKSGVTSIDALDIDEDSIKATKTNCELNQVNFFSEKSDLETFLIKEKNKTYDLILANILLPVILKTLPSMDLVTKSGSEMILSGLITSQKEEVLEACSKYNFELTEEITQGDWIGLRVKKK